MTNERVIDLGDRGRSSRRANVEYPVEPGYSGRSSQSAALRAASAAMSASSRERADR